MEAEIDADVGAQLSLVREPWTVGERRTLRYAAEPGVRSTTFARDGRAGSTVIPRVDSLMYDTFA